MVVYLNVGIDEVVLPLKNTYIKGFQDLGIAFIFVTSKFETFY